VVWLRIQLFWDVTLCCWASSSCIEGSRCRHLQGSSSMFKGEGTAVLPNTSNHSFDTVLHLRRLVSFKNAPSPGTGVGVHRWIDEQSCFIFGRIKFPVFTKRLCVLRQCGVPQPLQANAGIVPWLDHSCFLPDPFQFVIQQSLSHSVLRNLSYWQ